MPRSFKDRNKFLETGVRERSSSNCLDICNQCAWRENLNSQSILWLPESVDFAVDFDLI